MTINDLSSVGSSISRHRIMVVDDEPEIMTMVVDYLRKHNFEVYGSPSAEKAAKEIPRLKPDLIVLDKLMPGMSGNQLLTWLKQNRTDCNPMVLIISALDSEPEKVSSFELGVDDYLTKPFSLKEMLFRIKALLRRRPNDTPREHLAINKDAYTVFLHGKEVSLTLTEFRIITKLNDHFGQVCTRDQLREHALTSPNVTDRTIDVHIASLRRKLKDTQTTIKTVHGVGYKLIY